MYSSSLQGSTVIKQMRHFTGHYKHYGIIGVSKNLLEYQKVMTALHCSGWLSVCLTASSAGYFVHVLKLMLSFVSFISAQGGTMLTFSSALPTYHHAPACLLTFTHYQSCLQIMTIMLKRVGGYEGW